MDKKRELYVKSEGFINKNKNEFEKAIFEGHYLKRGDDKVLPITFKGEKEYKTIDFLEENSGVIVGKTGSGKTYFIRNVIKQWAMTTNPDELQLIVFDRNRLSGMKDVESLPHVLGVESDVAKLELILDGLLDECFKRVEALKETVDSNYSASIKIYNKNNEDKIPNIVFIIDDLTRILGDLVEDNAELYRSLKGKLSKISQIGRSLGVRLLLTAQRAIDTSIPKTVVSNSSFKFGLRLDSTDDYTRLGFSRYLERETTSNGKGYSRINGKGGGFMPKRNGEGVLNTMGEDIITAQSLEDGSNHDLKDIVDFWKGKEVKDVTKNIFSDKLKNLFK